VLHGDLGNSIRLHDSVSHLIAMRYPYTLALTLAALVLALVLAVRLEFWRRWSAVAGLTRCCRW